MNISTARQRTIISSATVILLGWIGVASALSVRPLSAHQSLLVRQFATVAPTETSSVASSYASAVLEKISSLREASEEYASSFDLQPSEAATFALFRAIRDVPVPLGLHGTPFVLRNDEICKAFGRDTTWSREWFTMADLEKACRDDFLDAVRGSTDARKGWQITTVSTPKGDSFEAARMTFEEVCESLNKGTVIFNAAGAHICKLAAPSLAACDATSLPCALNLYVTAANMKTSAPPHTDKQDVVVIQTSGRKHWKVFSVPDPSIKPQADIFARGKLEDNLPLYALENEWNCQLLIDTTLNPGDVMFCPAGFPHTTSTVADDDAGDERENDKASVHLTLGLDHHIWELDYLQTQRLALQRSNVVDGALGSMEKPFVGKVNELPWPLLQQVMAELPLGLLDDDDGLEERLEQATNTLTRISQEVSADTANKIESSVWKETVSRVRQQGMEIFETHRDMYLAAIDEGRTRDAEEAMTEHLNTNQRRVMTPERMQRLSLFRVKRFYDQINQSKTGLKQWALQGSNTADSATSGQSLPSDWAYTLPVNVGDEVEADLGGASFPARVTRASGDTYDVQFFDGDMETGLERSMMRLMNPPSLSVTSSDDIDASGMTKKQLKRWKKEQEQLQTKR